MKQLICLAIVSGFLTGNLAQAESTQTEAQKAAVMSPAETAEVDTMDELNPFDPNVEEKLQAIDEDYEAETGMSSHLFSLPVLRGSKFAARYSCVRAACPVWIQVVKSTQIAYLYIDGGLETSWKVSSGMSGYSTPNFDTHPNGRVYDAYSSKKFPGGDYQGLGNMPYAVFISGGFALHGTPKGNWSKLGSRASHGCIRMHPENAQYFNQLVRQYGVDQVWITVQD